MTKLLGKGFQVLSLADGKSIEVLYWIAPNGQCFTTWERPYDSVNFDKTGQTWNPSEGLPAEAVYIGTYPKPCDVSVLGADEKGLVRRMLCSCCGAVTKGRQWHNRDLGWGLCVDCISRCSQNETAEEFRRLYGDRGFHYDILPS